jgi:Flp pilus assembly protein TadB
MDNLPMWLVGLLVFVGIISAIALPISLLFWQAARDQRAANRKNQR